MLVCNGIVGLCLLVGGARHREQGFQVQGASAALAGTRRADHALAHYPELHDHDRRPGIQHPAADFRAGTASLVLYGSSVRSKPFGDRDYFLTIGEGTHAPPPSTALALVSAALLLASLVAVVGLAKALTPMVEQGLGWLGAPKAVVGIVIAALVLLPEGTAAVRAAHANRLQTSLNLALGSALASIGLTIPAVAVVSVVIGQPLARRP